MYQTQNKTWEELHREEIDRDIELSYLLLPSDEYEKTDEIVKETEWSEENTMSPKALGILYKKGKRVVIRYERGFPKNAELLYEHKLLYADHMTTSGSIYYYEYSELVPTDEDYDTIVNIYKELIKLSIIVIRCKFVRTEGRVYLSFPMNTYSRPNPAMTSEKYWTRQQYIKNSLPPGMNYEVVLMKLFPGEYRGGGN